MNKSDLILQLHKSYPFLNVDQVTSLVNLVFSELTKALKNKERIEIRGFGSFLTKERKVQSKFYDQDIKSVVLTKKNAVHFKLGKVFFDRLNKS